MGILMSDPREYTQGYCQGQNDALKEIEVYREKLEYVANVLKIASDWFDEVEIDDRWVRMNDLSEEIYDLLQEKYV